MKNLELYGKILAAAAVIISVGTGCTTPYQQEMNKHKTEPTSAEWGALVNKKFNVPVKIVVVTSNDAIGKSGVFFGQNIYHYPLRQLLEECYKTAMYNAFRVPGGEGLDAFELHIAPQCSILTTSGDTANYKLALYITFYEPGSKRITSFSLDKENSGPAGDLNQVPDVVYQTIRELAVETIHKISISSASTQTMSRFADK
ncbi:MAG: hypothetical protein WCI51_20770 [Lentisphaerota bacterium]